jgi:type VI secretion system secreted protein Hcp
MGGALGAVPNHVVRREATEGGSTMKRTRRTIAVAAAIAAGAAMAAGPAQAAKSTITFTLGNQSAPISSYSWGATNSGSGQAGGGAGAGKVTVQDLHMVKEADAMSVSLARATFTGQHAPAASLTFANGVFTSAFCFKDVTVTSFQTGATSGQDRPVDQFSLAFAQVGFMVGSESFNWDIAANGGADNPC